MEIRLLIKKGEQRIFTLFAAHLFVIFLLLKIFTRFLKPSFEIRLPEFELPVCLR